MRSERLPDSLRPRPNLQAALYQHPRQQGQRAMQVVFDYLVNGIAPEHDKYIMRNEIRILQNVE